MIQPYLARWGVRVITPPVGEQISLAEARLHLRLDDDGDSPPAHPDDPLIAMLITAAREWCEDFLGRAIAPQTVEISGGPLSSPAPTWCPCACARFSSDTSRQTYGAFIELPLGPVNYVSSIVYFDDLGVQQQVLPSDYWVDFYAGPPRLYAATGVTWPTVQAVPNAVRIRYLVGYDLPGDSPNLNPLPASIKAAMLLILGHYYENRENTSLLPSGTLQLIPMGAEALLRPYQLRMGFA